MREKSSEKISREVKGKEMRKKCGKLEKGKKEGENDSSLPYLHQTVSIEGCMKLQRQNDVSDLIITGKLYTTQMISLFLRTDQKQ